MKRIKAACICQTLHFMLKDDVPCDYAKELVKKEVADYKTSLDKHKTVYKIIDESELDDGSVIVKILKQYNQSPVGDYLN
ncbi:MAG: hypothetical protein LKG21_00730 [Ruminococcus sp.]|jgi:hypothetical protein|nr:hypothetical protein [Ruminococcus sp.]